MSAGLGGNVAIIDEMYDGIDCANLISETQAHGAENRELRDSICDSFLRKNVFNLAYTLNRQFGPDGIYKAVAMMNFLDNHNLPRFATAMQERKELIPLAWSLLPALPGFPCIFYGSEWGTEGWDE